MRVAYTRRTSACPVQRLYSVLPYVLRGSKKILFIDVPLYHPLGVRTAGRPACASPVPLKGLARLPSR